ncbi:MAG: aspartyl-tRNA(Asn)/glutamyl-tRNA(Gln) amidotransferase subunit B, partial [Glaciecola sp.]
GAGRLQGADKSLIDYNRAGIPLLEVVSRPDIHDPETAQAYVRELQAIVLALGVSDARLEEGSMRCDANVSVMRTGTTELGTRREIKNVNSIRSIGRAIAYEAQLQIDEIEAGGTIHMETRHWDESKGETSTLRLKETEADYRYFPDPDLVEMVCLPEWIDQQRASLPELPKATRERIVASGVRGDQAITIVTAGLIPAFDEAVAGLGLDAEYVANALTNQVVAVGKDHDLVITAGAPAKYVAEAIALTSTGDVALNKLDVLVSGGFAAGFTGSARAFAEANGLVLMSDTSALQDAVDAVIARNPAIVEKIKGGAQKAIGALVGQVMGATKGAANPGMVNDLLRQRILGD